MSNMTTVEKIKVLNKIADAKILLKEVRFDTMVMLDNFKDTQIDDCLGSIETLIRKLATTINAKPMQ